MNATDTLYLPDPLSFDASVLVAATLRPDFYYQELTHDIPLIDDAVKRLAAARWPIGWMRASGGYITMRAFKNCTAELTRAWTLNLMQRQGFIEKVLAGPREKLTVIMDAAVNDAHRADAAKRRAEEIYATAPRVPAGSTSAPDTQGADGVAQAAL